MSIRSRGTLLHGDRKRRELALRAFELGLESISPDQLMRSSVQFKRNEFVVRGHPFPVGRVFVIGFGKASGAMAETFERLVPVTSGIVIVPKGTRKRFRTKKIQLLEGTHPFPSKENVSATQKILALASEVTKEDVVVCLISGGGSSLLTLPREGLSLKDVQRISEGLMRGGASISELNEVRRCLSQVKGGQLGLAFKNAKIVNLVLSDVVHGSLADIASGPTVSSTHHYQRARLLLKRYLHLSSNDPIMKTLMRFPSKQSVRVSSHSFVLGDNNTVIDAASSFLRRQGMRPWVFRGLTGDARDHGKRFANLLNRNLTFVAGGETTVTVSGNGIGGRNQELCLSALSWLKNGVLLSAGTDGIDGSSPSAGAIVDSSTNDRASKKRLKPAKYLKNNDSHSFLKKTGDVIVTGPTGTNACDIVIGIA
ncbi:DUF4147 domain-containing protein [Candidatus Micrarchaeota archaeon]|nr:DUF4147 domain-containing protein [Candidatus Micrarchaeota archaeon]